MTEWDATEYSHHSSLQAAMAAEVLSQLALKGNERVLDVGCGEGKITAQVATRCQQGAVVGVDVSHDMIRLAREQFAAPNLRFEVADARSLPFRVEFDLVVSFNALHWVPDQEIALRSIHTALVPSGRAQLRLVPAGPQKSIETFVEETRRAPEWSEYFHDFRDPYLRLAPMSTRNWRNRSTSASRGLTRRIIRGISVRPKPSPAFAPPAATPGQNACRRIGAANLSKKRSRATAANSEVRRPARTSSVSTRWISRYSLAREWRRTC